MKHLFSVAVSLILFGCNNSESSADTSNSSENKPEIEQYCFATDAGSKDSIHLEITIVNTGVTGKLFYRIDGKDTNSGTLSGDLRGDTIIADYTFNSEGTSSVRQVAFLKNGDQLIEGFGPFEEIEGKIRFRSLSDLHFTGIVLSKITCADSE